MKLHTFIHRQRAMLCGLAVVLSAMGAQAAGPGRATVRAPDEAARAPITGSEPDYGPAFNFGGITYANKKAYIDTGARCGTREVPATELAVWEQQSREWTAQRISRGLWASQRPVGSVTVPVWFHVINKGTGTANGDVPQSWITAQLQVLNAAWSGPTSPFVFVLAGTTRTTNTAWYDMATDAAEVGAKTALHKGGVETLNIYVANLSGGLLGYAYYAQDAAAVGVLDGVVVLNQSLPGGNASPYNLGDTGTHEVGHWLGLAHTFEGGCSRSNDLVADTEPEFSPAFGCPVGRNTCKVTRTGDPIYNFMDYTDDACMNRFSGGQFVRMDAQHLQYRTLSP